MISFIRRVILRQRKPKTKEQVPLPEPDLRIEAEKFLERAREYAHKKLDK